MDKPTLNTYPLLPVIHDRWSPLAFDKTRPVETEKICSLLEAARWAPSSFNEQPWTYLVGNQFENPDAYEAIKAVIFEGNSWAFKAPVLMLSVAKLHYTHNNSPNRHGQHDVGLATSFLVLQAQQLGLSTHQMGGFDMEKAYETLHIPQDYEPMAAIAIGYQASPDVLDGKQRERELAPRARKPLQQFVFGGRWGETYPTCFT